MRVVLIALQVKGPMGQYIEALATPLGKRTDLHLFVPGHYNGEPGPFTVHPFQTGATRLEAARRMFNLAAAARVWREVKALRPDVVHLFNGEGTPWSLLWANRARREGIPFGLTVHDPDAHFGNPIDALQGFFQTQLGRFFLLPRVSWVHLHTARFRQTLVSRGAPPERIFVVPHGSLAGRFLRERRRGVAREDLALFFGRLEAYKGLDVLVEAGLRLGGSPRVAIAGPGKLPPELLGRIEARPDVFELHNRFLSEAEVAHLFQRASVCVMPYRNATQSSLPLISAAFGVPVVASAVGALTEDVPRVNGLLVPPGDVDALASGIKAAAGRPAHYPRELEFDHLADDFVANYERFGRKTSPALAPSSVRRP